HAGQDEGQQAGRLDRVRSAPAGLVLAGIAPSLPHISPRVRGTQGKGAHREGSWMLKLLRALFLILGIPNAVLGLPLLVVWIQRSSSDAPLGLDALVPAGSAGLTLGLYFLLSLQLRVKGQEALDAVRRGE